MLNMQKKLTNPFYMLLSLPSTAMGFALSIQIAALSWILSTQYHLEIHDIGLVWAAGPIAGILGQVVIGLISDKVWFWGGRRKPFIIIGGVLASLMLLALPNLDVISNTFDGVGILTIAIIVALSLDMAINVSFNPTRSIIADVTPTGDERTKGYTWMQTVSGTFGVLAYFIGAQFGNYFLIYFGAIFVLLLSLIPPFFIEEPAELVAESDYEQQSFSLGALLKQISPLWGFLFFSLSALAFRLLHIETSLLWLLIPSVLLTLWGSKSLFSSLASAQAVKFHWVLLAHGFAWLGIQSMFVYMFSYVQYAMPALTDVEMGKVVAMSFLILNAVGAALPVLVLKPLAEKFGRTLTHAGAVLVMASGYAGIYWMGDSVWMIYSLMAILGVGWASTISLPFAIMSQDVSQDKMGTFMGLFNLSVVLPQLVASLGVGVLISQAEDKGITFVICSISLLLSAICWWSLARKEGQE